jgi:adenine/guanine phosphoribosyltransferase-like PRPP-binding protein
MLNPPMTKHAELKARLSAVEMLMLLKQTYTYRGLASLLELPVPVLSRYVNGHVLPSLERAQRISTIFFDKHLKEFARQMLRLEDGVFDNSAILGNPNLLDKIAKLVAPKFAHLRVDKVLTVEVDGIPVATHLAMELGVETVVAKGRKEMGINSFVEVRRVHTSGTYSYLYVPTSSIGRGDRILLVDDVVRTGSTVRTLLQICQAASAEAVGLFALIGVKRGMERLRGSVNFPSQAFLEV